MTVKINILYDNRCGNPALQEGWGFSAVIEHGGSKILFDTGGDPAAFFANINKAGISLKTVTHCLFSHRHWDHIAGFKELLKHVDKETPFFVPKTFPWTLRRAGAQHLTKLRVVNAFEEVAPNIFALVMRGGFWLYELSLVIKTPKGLGIITGCAHPGIVTIVKKAQEHFQADIDFVLGGFHLLFSPAARCAEIVKELQALKIKRVAPCHCSGDHLISQLQEAYGSNFCKVGTGSELTF